MSKEVVSKHFGAVSYTDEQIIHFPVGLPAFEEHRQFLLMEQEATAPVVFLQSLSWPELSFITLPLLLVDPSYRLALSPEDLELLALPTDRQPALGAEVYGLAIITVPEGGPPTANLAAPIVVNTRTRQAVQAILADAGYSHAHALSAPEEETECS